MPRIFRRHPSPDVVLRLALDVISNILIQFLHHPFAAFHVRSSYFGRRLNSHDAFLSATPLLVPERVLYSYFNATIGFTRIARRAGTNAASTATEASANATAIS